MLARRAVIRRAAPVSSSYFCAGQHKPVNTNRALCAWIRRKHVLKRRQQTARAIWFAEVGIEALAQQPLLVVGQRIRRARHHGRCGVGGTGSQLMHQVDAVHALA